MRRLHICSEYHLIPQRHRHENLVYKSIHLWTSSEACLSMKLFFCQHERPVPVMSRELSSEEENLYGRRNLTYAEFSSKDIIVQHIWMLGSVGALLSKKMMASIPVKCNLKDDGEGK